METFAADMGASWVQVVLLAVLLAGCAARGPAETSTQSPSSPAKPAVQAIPWRIEVVVAPPGVNFSLLGGDAMAADYRVPPGTRSLAVTSTWTCDSGPTCPLALVVHGYPVDGEDLRMPGESPIAVELAPPFPAAVRLAMNPDIEQASVVANATGEFRVVASF